MRISPTNKPQIFITMGDPAGIGPEVIMKTMASPAIRRLAVFVIIADSGVIKKNPAGLSLEEVLFHPNDQEVTLDEERINVLDPGPELGEITPGQPTDEGARKALDCIDLAIRAAGDPENNTPKAIVTAPVCKEAIANIHPGFIGHTEYLQNAFSSELVTMVMVGKTFSVVPVTRHIPLKEVPSVLSLDLIYETLKQVVEGRHIISGKEDPHISVTALNPHSGEGGRIGREEIDLIRPAVDKARSLYGEMDGPVSADVVFYRAMHGKTDIVVGMYHDQCLAPFKMVEFDKGINMTLGLGCVRTSPDHGTAFDIAGKGIANHASMEEAVKLAIRAVVV